jgi:hypothetical protein
MPLCKATFKLFGILALLLLLIRTTGGGTPAQAAGSIYYVNGQTGNDSQLGTSPGAAWRTVAHAVGRIKGGDTVVIAAGIYRVTELRFGPAGLGADRPTTFKAAPGARVIFSSANDTPPPVYVSGDYVRLEGLWFGGKWSASSSSGIFPGGSPVGRGKQFVGCTVFGYEGLGQGSAEYFLYQHNRFVAFGKDRFSHGIYLSGGTTAGSRAQHAIVDNNIFVAGKGGYAIHGWHQWRSSIISRNFIGGSVWGLVTDGSDHLVANNFLWRQKGLPGQEGPIGAWLPGQKIVFINNIVGPDSPIIGSLPTNSVVKRNAFLGASPKGDDPIILSSGQETAQLGVSAQTIDQTIAALDQAFAQPVSAIYTDSSIEPAFTKLRAAIPAGSPLYRTGQAWQGGSLPVNIGPDTPAPSSSDGFWNAFRSQKLCDWNSYGQVVCNQFSIKRVFLPLLLE